MIEDLHSHTGYSFCGKDDPQQVVDAAIAGGIEVLGISDHNHGVGYRNLEAFLRNEPPPENYQQNLNEYYHCFDELRRKNREKITLLRGIELCTHTDNQGALPAGMDVSFFDYCLVENLDAPNSITHGDLFAFAQRCGCKTGVAHTDLFAFIHSLGQDPLNYFSAMAQQGIFWELNVSYDSIHNFHEHAYVKAFFADEQQQEIVRRSGVELSVGFDGHRCAEYRADRVRETCARLEELGIPLAFSKGLPAD